VVALHSGLTPAQRLQNWLAAHLGQADLANIVDLVQLFLGFL
jgi:primosomal protein N'